MSHVHEGPLATYNSLTDSHLAGYFANSRMRRHLRKAGLVSRKGQIVSESTYRLNMSRREHKQHVKDMLAQAIVHKTLDMERSRQAEIKKKLEEIAKIQLVRRVRASTSKKGDEDVLPLLTPRSGGSSCSPSPRGRSPRAKKSPSPRRMAGVRRGESRLTDRSGQEDGDVLYLDDEGRPITPSALTDQRPSPEPSNIDTRHLHSLDSVALRKYALLVAQMEEGRGLTSPYMMPQMPLPPRPPSSGPTPRSFRRVHSASPRRTVTTDSRLARLHRPETAKSHAGDQQTRCHVVMKYHGWALHLAREKLDRTQEVVIEQQHCGGNTLTVFKERLEPGAKFEFISYRHRGYPFSLSLYVDGKVDSRISTCCEYRHSRGAKIGGKQGHFSLLRVTGAVPCYKCQVAKGVRHPNKAAPKKLKRPAEVHREEVTVVSTRRDRQQEDEDLYAEDEFEAAEDEYADDFEDSQASEKGRSPSYSSSSSSESESGRESVTPKEETKKQEKKEEERKNEEEFFQPREDRGAEREEEEEDMEEAGSPRGRESDRQYSAPSPRVEVNGTGRQIDDYSSDDEADGKVKVVSVEDADVDSTQIRGRRRSSSSSSSSSSADERTQTASPQDAQGEEAPPVISMDRLNKEEKREEDAQKDRERREDIRRREEQVLQQKQQDERQRRLEERRQEDLLRQRQREEERHQREEQRRADAEQERQRREAEEESRRRAAELKDDPEARERELSRGQSDRNDRILQEQRDREQQRQQQEQEREKAWQQQEAHRAEKRRRDAEDRRRRSAAGVAGGSSTARSDSSAARDNTSSAVSETSSAVSTPRHVPTLSVPGEDGDGNVVNTRPVSPLPPAAVYEDRSRLREGQEDGAPPRATSPFPEPAVYDPDWRRHRQQQQQQEQNMHVREPSPARAVSPLPPPAVYEDRQKAPRASAKAAPLPYKSESSSGDDDDEDEDDDDAFSTASLESVHEGRVFSAKYLEDLPVERETEPRHSKKAATYEDEDPFPSKSKQVESYLSEDASENERPPARHSKKQLLGVTSSSEDESSSTPRPPERDQNRAGPGGRQQGTDETLGLHGTSESDGENMHGGADPDNVAEQEEGEELHPLRTRDRPAAKAHQGEITDLLKEGKDSVDLSNVLLNKTQVFQLASHLEGSRQVKMVALCNAGLDNDDLQRLTEALAASPSEPVMLNLSLNAISQKGVQHVLHVLKAKPSIKLLILQGNPLGDEGARDLTDGLQDLHRQARAARKALAMETADTMSVDSSSSSIDPSMMAQRYLLQELDLTDTEVSDEGASHLARLVAGNVYLENVNLSQNPRITPEGGWKQVGEALARNRCIRILTLDGNRLGDEGVGHIARGLQNNRVLRSLALEDAGIGPAGGQSLMDMLKRNTSLLELTLSPGNTIPHGLSEDIGKYIALNRAPYNFGTL